MILGFLIVLVISVCPASAQGPVVLYDPLSKISEYQPVTADEKIVQEKLVAKARTRWAELDSCDGSNANIIGAVDGSFTRPGAKQRAIVYELCQIGNGFANNGLAIIENGRVIAHFTEAGGWNLEVSRVPDVNRNGRDELAIETGGGMHQGYTGSSVTVLEISETTVTELGIFLAYSNSCENYAPDKYCDRSYKLTVKPGAKPVFYAQKFTNRGTDEKPRWTAAGRPLPAKRLGDTKTEFEAVK